MISIIDSKNIINNFIFSSLHYWALPIEGHWHHQTVPVRLHRGQNNEYEKHEDVHVERATIRYMKDFSSNFGNDCVTYHLKA